MFIGLVCLKKQEKMMKKVIFAIRDSFLFVPLFAFLNWLGDVVRRMLGVGPSWIMYKKLARKLVDEGHWFFVPLTSGMQMPVIDAVFYLKEISDTDSIPRLKLLFGRYAGAQAVLDRYHWQEGVVTSTYGPGDHMPKDVQFYTANALLSLLPPDEAKEFVISSLSSPKMELLGHNTIRMFVYFLIDTGDMSMSSLLLDTGKFLKNMFEDEWYDIQRGTGGSYDHLYGYEDCVYGAWKLATNDNKEEPLLMLVDEYNRQESDAVKIPGMRIRRTHCHIEVLLYRMIYEDLASEEMEQKRVISLLDPKQFEHDTQFFPGLKKTSGQSK